MKFLVDAHLLRRLAYRLRDAGHDAIHTLDLPRGNRTGDNEIIEIAVREQCIVVTKGADFMNSFWVTRQPPKLLLVSTGNITNADLEALFLRWMEFLADAFSSNNFLELTRSQMLIHE